MRWKTGLLIVVLLAASTAGAAERWQVAEGSYVLAVTGKAGLLKALGHRHAVLGETLEADVCHDPADPVATRATFTVPTASLVIDTERGLELAELEGGLSEEDVAQIQADMLSERYLGAEEHPRITLTLKQLRIGREGPWRVSADFTLHGVTRQVTFPLEVHRERSGLTADGSFTVKQTDHGVKPASVAGVVKVADPVDVRIHLVARPTGEECRP